MSLSDAEKKALASIIKGFLKKDPNALQELLIEKDEKPSNVEEKRRLQFGYAVRVDFQVSLHLEPGVTDGQGLGFVREMIPSYLDRMVADNPHLIIEKIQELGNTCPDQDTRGTGTKRPGKPPPEKPNPPGGKINYINPVRGFGAPE